MKISCGIIGLPNVGKSTLFKLLTNINVKIANFPFCTITPNVAIIEIPDERLCQLNNIIKARSTVRETIEFIDVAGLIQGAVHGTGLGLQILNYIQNTTILCHMVRCFENDTVFHIENNIDPGRDINLINTEFILFDIEHCEKLISFFKKKNRIANKFINQKLFILNKCLNLLYQGVLLRKALFLQTEKEIIREFNFLTFKPVFYVANIEDQKKHSDNIYVKQLSAFIMHSKDPVVLFCPDCFYESKSTVNQKEYVLNTIINNVKILLHSNIFFTVNSNMIRAWLYMNGTTAYNIANIVHSDFKKGFIRVQVIKFKDFIKYQGEEGAKKIGKVYYEGKNYCVQEGDILKFLFKV